MFDSREVVNLRMIEANRLQNSLITKLYKVQKLTIKRLLRGETIVFEINSFAKAALLHGIDDIVWGHEYHKVQLKHYPFMDFDWNNSICEFYKEQHRIIDYWIKILS